jgi:hypothetical protein
MLENKYAACFSSYHDKIIKKLIIILNKTTKASGRSRPAYFPALLLLIIN